jgi:hypothetical protein
MINQPDYRWYLTTRRGELRIESGWQYKGDAFEHWTENHDRRSDLMIISKRELQRRGFDIDDDSIWTTGILPPQGWGSVGTSTN